MINKTLYIILALFFFLILKNIYKFVKIKEKLSKDIEEIIKNPEYKVKGRFE